MAKPKLVGFVPIRLNSKRVPGKSVRLLAGRPLLQYNLETLLSIGLDEVIVYCSDPDIQGYLPVGVRWLQRSPELDSDQTRGIEVWTAFERDVDADIVVMSHATAPFIKGDSISKGIARVRDEGYLSSCSVREIKTYCWFKGEPLNFTRSAVVQTQLLEPILEETGGFYIWRKGVVGTHGTRLSPHHSFVPVSEVEAVDIDYPDDFGLAEIIVRGSAVVAASQ